MNKDQTSISPHNAKRIQGAGLALLAGWSAFTIVWIQVSIATVLSLLVLDACVGLAVFLNLGRVWQSTAANLVWLSSASVAMNLLDSWVYAALFPDLKGVVLAATPGVIAFAIWLATFALTDRPRSPKWNALSLFWLILSESLWLGLSNFQDEKTLFFGGLLLLLLTLILSKRRFRYGFLGAQMVNTAILLLVALPVADVVVRFRLSPPAHENGTSSIIQPPRDGRVINAQNAHFFYSYDEAQGDPGAFATFYSHFQIELYSGIAPGCYEPMPGHNPPYRLRPNGRGKFIDVVHFTQEGRQKLAENVFASLRRQLQQDLARATNAP